MQHLGALLGATWKTEEVQNIDDCLFRWASHRQYNSFFLCSISPLIKRMHTISLSATKEPEAIKLFYLCKAPQIYNLNL